MKMDTGVGWYAENAIKMGVGCYGRIWRWGVRPFFFFCVCCEIRFRWSLVGLVGIKSPLTDVRGLDLVVDRVLTAWLVKNNYARSLTVGVC